MSADGELFIVLVVRDGITLVKSKETGLYYPTAKKASIPSTFDEATCKSLIGQQLDGSIEKMEFAPYEFINEETGEVITLDQRWLFVKAGDSVQRVVEAE
jgi:hypothetical protein